MILEIDAGNSRIKWRIVDQGDVQHSGVVAHDEASWSTIIACGSGLKRVRVVNVAGVGLAHKLGQWTKKYFQLEAEFAVSQKTTAGVTNGYVVPETLGVDRWLAVVAGWNMARKPCLIVDAGSALTVDFVSAGGEHRGGYIVPGLYMMFQALYGGTADVRFEQSTYFSQSPGDNTADAVGNGCFVMSAALVDRALGQLESVEGPAIVLLTGGGAQPFLEYFKERVKYLPDLVLEGLGFALP